MHRSIPIIGCIEIIYIKVKDKTNQISLIESLLGPQARLLGWSKSNFASKNLNSLPVFNACIFNDKGQFLWWGDVDIILDKSSLLEVAKLCNCSLYILHESDVDDEKDWEDMLKYALRYYKVEDDEIARLQGSLD